MQTHSQRLWIRFARSQTCGTPQGVQKHPTHIQHVRRQAVSLCVQSVDAGMNSERFEKSESFLSTARQAAIDAKKVYTSLWCLHTCCAALCSTARVCVRSAAVQSCVRADSAEANRVAVSA